MKVTVLDTVTGKTKVVSGYGSFQWAENNLSCDCNRNEWDVDIELNDDYCHGSHRFIVVDAEFDIGETMYTIKELNKDYPDGLLSKFDFLISAAESKRNKK